MRSFIAGLVHETNSFSAIPTASASFDEVYRPDGSFAPPRNVSLLGYGTFAELALAAGHDVRLGLFASAQPSAPLNAVDYAAFKAEILGALRAALPVDIVFLFMHGAMIAEGCDDCEGDLISCVREMAGPGTVIGVLLDLHGNVSRRMIDDADLVMSCLEYPHTDYTERARIAFDILTRSARQAIRPRSCALRVPFFGVYPTISQPMQSFVTRLRASEARPGALAISALHGFFLGDTPHTGGCVIAVTDGDSDLAEQLARETANDLFDTARQVKLGVPLEPALDDALVGDEGPVVLADRADNPGGGAAGDSTFVLRALLERRVTNTALALLWDPMAVELAHLVGVGRRFALRLGGKTGPMSGQPLDVTAEVLCLRNDAKQAMFGQGTPAAALGRSAALRIEGIDVVVNSNRQQVFSTHVFTEHAIDPASKRLLVVKSTQHFVAGFGSLARRIVYADAPGAVSMNIGTLPFKSLQRPVYPMDVAGLEIRPLAVR